MESKTLNLTATITKLTEQAGAALSLANQNTQLKLEKKNLYAETKKLTEEKAVLEQQIHDAFSVKVTAEKDRQLLMEQVSQMNLMKREQKIENFELQKKVNRLTLSMSEHS